MVITGMGALSPLGLSVPELWEGLLAGRSGIGPITQFDASGLPVRIAGEVKGFDPTVALSPKEARRMARCSQFAVVAALEAVRDAGFPSFPDPERVGTLIGVGMGGYEVADRQIQIFRTQGLTRVSPFALVASIPNMPSHHVSVYFGARGPIATVAAACATGAQAIGEAAEWIRRGIADVVICGGVEALITDFAAMRALSTRNEEPERASRPFDADRDGFVYAEGAGILVLERLSHARARGARIYAEVLGYGNAADAHHVTAPEPDGAGAARAMQ
ncbi:MAG: beta-ketoacyl-[acyl-carrier-protein] synthase II, partial [Thermoflexus sp.]